MTPPSSLWLDCLLGHHIEPLKLPSEKGVIRAAVAVVVVAVAAAAEEDEVGAVVAAVVGTVTTCRRV